MFLPPVFTEGLSLSVVNVPYALEHGMAWLVVLLVFGNWVWEVMHSIKSGF